MDRILSLGGRQVALISTSDDWIRFVIQHRSVLNSSYGLIVQPENATLELCLDKMAFSEWCVASGLPCPEAWIPGRGLRPTSLGFPVLLRPVRTLHGNRELGLPKAVEARTESELVHWLEQFEAKRVIPLVTESLLGRSLEQYSVPFARRGGKTLLFTARKVRPSAELCQAGTCVEICVDERIEHLGRTAVERLDYFGIGEVEILRDKHTGKDYLIEINARPWLQYALAPASNHDFLGLVLNLPTAAEKTPVRAGKTWVSLHQDLFVAFSRSVGMVRHGRLGLFSYLRSLARSNVFALFDWRDPRPFLLSLRRR
jgi:predicted ATP-grasp superfamily ATP-dependent carboligase